MTITSNKCPCLPAHVPWKVSLPMGDVDPHLIHDSWDQWVLPKQHLNHFCTAHLCAKHADRDICSNRPHLCNAMHMIRPKNSWQQNFYDTVKWPCWTSVTYPHLQAVTAKLSSSSTTSNGPSIYLWGIILCWSFLPHYSANTTGTLAGWHLANKNPPYYSRLWHTDQQWSQKLCQLAVKSNDPSMLARVALFVPQGLPSGTEEENR